MELIVDRNVSLRKFKRETDTLLRLRNEYLARGWDIKEVSYPTIKIHFLNSSGKAVIGIIVDCNDYNFMPVSVVYTNTKFEPLKFNQLPIFVCQGARPLVIQEHPLTHRPFICLPGIREYHSHYEHHDNHWDLHRYPEVYNIYNAIRVAHEQLRLG